MKSRRFVLSFVAAAALMLLSTESRAHPPTPLESFVGVAADGLHVRWLHQPAGGFDWTADLVTIVNKLGAVTGTFERRSDQAFNVWRTSGIARNMVGLNAQAFPVGQLLAALKKRLGLKPLVLLPGVGTFRRIDSAGVCASVDIRVAGKRLPIHNFTAAGVGACLPQRVEIYAASKLSDRDYASAHSRGLFVKTFWGGGPKGSAVTRATWVSRHRIRSVDYLTLGPTATTPTKKVINHSTKRLHHAVTADPSYGAAWDALFHQLLNADSSWSRAHRWLDTPVPTSAGCGWDPNELKQYIGALATSDWMAAPGFKGWASGQLQAFGSACHVPANTLESWAESFRTTDRPGMP